MIDSIEPESSLNSIEEIFVRAFLFAADLNAGMSFTFGSCCATPQLSNSHFGV